MSFPESHVFVKTKGIRARLMPGWITRMNLERFVHTVEAETFYTPRRMAIRPQAYRRDFVRLLDKLAHEHKKNAWLEKTTGHVLAIHKIRKLAPESQFIHLIRDGRAVVASLYEVTRKHPEIWNGARPLEGCVSEWNDSISASSEALKRGTDGIVVHYERLTKDPISEIKKLCDFLKLTYEPHMLSNYPSATSGIIGSEETWKSRVSGPIHDAGLQKYHAMFSHEQRHLIESSLLPLPANLRHDG
jgi:hypothetical protein